MSCGTTLGPTEHHLVSVVGVAQYAVYSAWMATIGLDMIRVLYNARALLGTFQYQFAFQTAVARTDNPDAWAVLDTPRTASGETCPGDLTLSLGGKWFIRFGAMYDETTTPGTSQGDLALTMEFNACGKVAGGGSYQLSATDTTPLYQIVSGWVPACMAAKHKAAFIASQTGTNFRFKIAYQVATNINSPGTWATADADHNGDGELCTNDLTTANVAGNMWVRFAIMYWSTSGVSMGNVTTMVGSRT